MRKSFYPMSAAMIGFSIFVLGAPAAHADETTQICINNTAEKSMHFDVHFKDGGVSNQTDSTPFDSGEKCIDIPVSSTDLELNVYKKMFIIWDKVCTKSWDTAPTEGVHGELADSASGIECVGI